jgi:TPR repeat protein
MGIGTTQNFIKSAEYFSKAAEQGDVLAQYKLARAYAEGVGLKKDMQKSVFWYTKSAEQGYMPSQIELGIIYTNGKGVPKNYSEAIRLFQLAVSKYDKEPLEDVDNIDPRPYLDSAKLELSKELAAKGDVNEQYSLAERYLNADGVLEDETKAVEFLKQAASHGHLEAQRRLGNAYSLGVGGVAKDHKKAEKWWTLSAKNGNTTAQLLLAEKYFQGGQLTKDIAKSIYWYQQASAQGSNVAQMRLAVFYETGNGVKKDLVLAYAWANLAASNGDATLAEQRDRFASKLTSEEKLISQRISSDWTKGKILEN